MALKKKTRKAIRKEVERVINKHGPKIASELMSSLLTLVGTDNLGAGNGKSKKTKKKSKAGAQAANMVKKISKKPAVTRATEMLPDAGNSVAEGSATSKESRPENKAKNSKKSE
jgi:hypothetical protein